MSSKSTKIGCDVAVDGIEKCILIGYGATPDKLRTRVNEMLFVTEDDEVLFSDGKVYHNGNQVAQMNNETVGIMLRCLDKLDNIIKK